MNFCVKCGNQMNDGDNVCTKCGTPVNGGRVSLGKDPQPDMNNQQAQPNMNNQQYQQTQPNKAGNDLLNKILALNNTPDTTAQYDSVDIQNSTLMGVLSYLSVLVLIPIFCAKNSPFSQFHANQGLVICLIEIAWGIISSIIKLILPFGIITFVCGLVSLVTIAVQIIGIVNVIQGKAKELPVIGGIRILK